MRRTKSKENEEPADSCLSRVIWLCYRLRPPPLPPPGDQALTNTTISFSWFPCAVRSLALISPNRPLPSCGRNRNRIRSRRRNRNRTRRNRNCGRNRNRCPRRDRWVFTIAIVIATVVAIVIAFVIAIVIAIVGRIRRRNRPRPEDTAP